MGYGKNYGTKTVSRITAKTAACVLSDTSIYADTTVKDKVTAFFDKFNEVCNKVNENGAVKLLGTTIVPILSLLTQL